MTVLLLQ